MRLIANKPCSFGGRKFYIGDEIPADLVADAKTQEKMGVITIVNDAEGVPARESGTFYTQEQVDEMIADAVAKSEEKISENYDNCVLIFVKGENDEGNGMHTPIFATPDEICTVFRIMQMNADEGVKEISKVESNHVLILLHASDSRKTIKEAAKKQAGNLFSTNGDLNEARAYKETIATKTEGVDT